MVQDLCGKITLCFIKERVIHFLYKYWRSQKTLLAISRRCFFCGFLLLLNLFIIFYSCCCIVTHWLDKTCTIYLTTCALIRSSWRYTFWMTSSMTLNDTKIDNYVTIPSLNSASACFVFCLSCCFSHSGTVSSPNHTFFLGKLELAVNQCFVHILLLVADNSSSWMIQPKGGEWP